MSIVLDGTNGIDSPDLTISGVGARITGDFSNATIANRVMFQSSTTNGNTVVTAIPNGTSNTSAFRAANNQDPTNSSIAQLWVNGTSNVGLDSNILGTGTYLPMTFSTGGAERMRIDTSGNVGIGSTENLGKFSVVTGAQGTDGVHIGSSSSYYISLKPNLAGANYNPSVQNGDSAIIFSAGSPNTGALVIGAWSASHAAIRINSAGNFQFNSGYGSVATAYGCRAWVNFNGTGTVAIRGSGNVTSISDNGVGNYAVNLTNVMPDVNYTVVGSCKLSLAIGTVNYDFCVTTTNNSTSAPCIQSRTSAGTLQDAEILNVAVFR